MRLLIAVFFALVACSSQAGQFAVSPIRLELNAKDKSQAITVSNHGTSSIRIALDLRRWTQNAQGQDQYTPAPDELVYFPRQFELAAQQTQVIRLGRKTAASESEKAYRLYINEQPDSNQSANAGQVAMVVSFGVPVFIRPAAPKLQLESSELKAEKGQLHITLHNRGNVTQRLNRMLLGGTASEAVGEIRQFEQWYLHPGISRSYQLTLPETACNGNVTQVRVETDVQAISTPLQIPASACKP